MARTAQTMRPREPKSWHQRQYLDHEGKPVILGKYSRSHDFKEPDGIYEHRLQVYSTVSVPPETYFLLYEFLFGMTGPGPFLELYTSIQPDGIACAEHQRREIAHRKKLHANADQNTDFDSLPPLIAKSNSYSKTPEINDEGSCLLLTSESYLARANRGKADELGTTPIISYFNRQFTNEIQKIKLRYRVDELRNNVPSFLQYGNQLLPEAVEVDAYALPDHSDMDYQVSDLWREVRYHWTADQGLEIDYGLAERSLGQRHWDYHEIKDTLGKQDGADYEGEIRLRKGADDSGTTITATNYESGENDLQYVIDVLFLAGLVENTSLLETTARIFTTRFLMELKSVKKRKKIKFQFRIPGPNLSSVLEFPHSFPVGVFQDVGGNAEKQRVVPVYRTEIPWRSKPRWDKFAVVLDKPAFITEPGVLFMIHSRLPNPETGGEDNIIFRRSAGMPQVGDRLSMLVIEDKRGFEDLRWLTDTEFREIHDMSMEEYHSAFPNIHPPHR